MAEKVSFTAMEHGTREDYELIAAHDREYAAQLADRVLQWLRQMDDESPYRVSRLEHCLQTATRAERDGADDETVVCALLQGGKGLPDRGWEAAKPAATETINHIARTIQQHGKYITNIKGVH